MRLVPYCGVTCGRGRAGYRNAASHARGAGPGIDRWDALCAHPWAARMRHPCRIRSRQSTPAPACPHDNALAALQVGGRSRPSLAYAAPVHPCTMAACGRLNPVTGPTLRCAHIGCADAGGASMKSGMVISHHASVWPGDFVLRHHTGSPGHGLRAAPCHGTSGGFWFYRNVWVTQVCCSASNLPCLGSGFLCLARLTSQVKGDALSQG